MRGGTIEVWPTSHGSRHRRSRRLRYAAILTVVGAFTAWLAVDSIPSAPFLLCAMAPFALAMRLHPLTALSSALLVAWPLGDGLLAGLLVVGTAVIAYMRHRDEGQVLRHRLFFLWMVPALVLVTVLRGEDDLLRSMLAFALLALGLFASYFGAVQIDAQASSTARRQYATLADQLAASLTVVASAPLCILLLAVYAGWERVDAQAREASVEQVRAQIGASVESFLTLHLNAIRYAATETTLPHRLPRLDAVQRVAPGFLTLLVTDAHGNIEHFHAPGSLGFFGDVADRSYFTEPRRTGHPFVSEVFRGRGFGNDILVAVSAPHHTQQGAFAGVVEGSLSLSALQHNVSGWARERGAEFVLHDGFDKVVTGTLPEMPSLAPWHGERLEVASTPRAVSVNRAGTDLISGMVIPQLDWKVHALLPLAPLERDRMIVKLIVGLACLGIILFFSASTRGFVQRFLAPLREMVARIREVDLAEASTLTPLEVRASSADFAELVADFNHMLRRLSELNAELVDSAGQQKALNMQLESRVAERTAALQDALLRAEHLASAKSMFLANMSHELRTPLTAILGFAEQALRESEPRSTWHETLRTIARNGRHLLDVVNDVLDAGKIDSGQMQTERVALSPVLLAHEVVRMLRERAVQKGLSLDIDYRWPLPALLHSDPFRLRQVLINLLGNAIKFTQRGMVKVRLSAENQDWLKIAVLDSGAGMSSEQKARLFKPFEQGDLGTTRKFGGSGLGLYITGKLVEALGGRITVESTPEVGSEFTVLLPVQGDAEWLQGMPELPATDEDDVEVPRLEGRVLVVDDVADLRALVENLVRATGARTQSAEHGAQAVERALQDSFDLILMDMHMPVMDGRSATRALRARGCATPIVALTADVLPEDVERFRQAGCNAVLSKPLDRGMLYQLMREHLRPAAESAPARSDTLSPDDAAAERMRALERTLEDVRGRFVERSVEEVDGLQRELSGAQTDALLARLHKLKGSAASFGFDAVASHAARAEAALKRGDTSWTVACMDTIDALRRLAIDHGR